MKKHVVRCICFFLLLISFFGIASELLLRNEPESMTNVKGFFQEPDNSLDVVTIGPSELYAAYSPPLAWKEYGYTSYNLSVAGVRGSLYPSMLSEVLRHQSPKLIVFNVSGFYWGDDQYPANTAEHIWFDSTPWSLHKINQIQKVIPENEQSEFYFPLLKYHANWKEPLALAKTGALRLLMDWNGMSYTKGMRTFSIDNDGAGVNQGFYMTYTDSSRKALLALLKYCKQHELKNVLFVSFPHQGNPSDPEALNKIAKDVKNSGYDFLNLDKDYDQLPKQEWDIDNYQDFSDSEHLNVRGMRKMTSYLGSYIASHYDVKQEHSKKVIAQWNHSEEKTAELLDDCEKDLNQGIPREYYEACVYHKTKRMTRGLE